MLGDVQALLLVFPELPLWTASIVHSGISSGASSHHHLLQTNPDLVEVMTAGSPAAIKGFRPFTEEEFTVSKPESSDERNQELFFPFGGIYPNQKTCVWWWLAELSEGTIWTVVHASSPSHAGPQTQSPHRLLPKIRSLQLFPLPGNENEVKGLLFEILPQFTWSLMHLKNWTSRTCLLRRLRLILRLPVAIILMFYPFKPHRFFPVMRRAKGRLIVKKSMRKWHHHWIYE